MESMIMHEDGVIQVKVPLPFPLRWVNGYLLRGEDGYTLMDPGLHTRDAEEVWRQALRTAGAGFPDIRQIVLTHHHPDHYGLAGWMQEQTKAPVFLSRTGWEHARRLWGERQPLTGEILALFRRHGMDEPALAAMKAHLDSFVPLVTPEPEVRFLPPGGTFRLGDREYRLIEAPGHAAGQILFHDVGRKVIFCGDQVLPRISPNVSLVPGSEADPLGSFLASLGELRRLDIVRAYPGHREPFAGFAGRAEELLRHHDERLGAMLARLERPLTAYTLCRIVFGDRLSVHQLRFALAETLAHLAHLRNQGRAVEEDGGSAVYYRAVRG
jgi:glyoxylase-like metal-dependent hydrolase (beta-lactamase superfamily II)